MVEQATSRSRVRALRAAFAIAVFLVACGSDDGNGGAAARAGAGGQPCVPGIAQECPCSDGSRGVSICDAAGSAFGTCSCREGAQPVQPSTAGAAGVATPAAGAGGLLGGTSAAGTGTAAGTGGSPATAPPDLDLARGVRIREIAIYQAVKIPLMQDGAAVVARNAPVIVGKDALLRVFVETLPGFAVRELRAELELVSSEGAAQPLSVTQRISASSTDPVLDSTLNFDIPGASVTADVRYAVALREASGAAANAAAPDPGARWPAAPGERAALSPRSAGPVRVVLVPYRYMADGSGRLPATDDAEIAEYRDTLRVYYPASEIEIELHAPVDYTGMVGPQTGWNEWLDFHCSLRGEEMPDPKVLYYGTIAPTDGWRSYGGGVVGISPVPSPAGNYGRCSVGIGFPGGAGTMAHELGHALGLPHAPCGTEGGPFPYPEAKIGSWGYGLVSGMLRDPDEYYDLMSYCDPSFISDFNYERLFERIRYLNLQFDVRAGRPSRYVRLLDDGTGRARFRGTIELDLPPGGPDEERDVTLLDRKGRASGSARAYFFPFSQAGGLWLVPDTGAAAVRLGGHAARLHE